MATRRFIPEPHEVLTTTELARWLKKSPRTVERMRLPTVVPGRYLFEDVLEELKRRRTAKRRAA